MSQSFEWRPEWGRPLQALQDEVNRLLTQLRAAPVAEQREGAWSPAVDLVENPTEIRLLVDLPGVSAKAIDLTVNGAVLTIQGTRDADPAEPGRRLVRERPVGAFFRQVTLPCEVEIESIRAEVREGILDVVLPKAEALRPRSIPIRTGEDRQ